MLEERCNSKKHNKKETFHILVRGFLQKNNCRLCHQHIILFNFISSLQAVDVSCYRCRPNAKVYIEYAIVVVTCFSFYQVIRFKPHFHILLMQTRFVGLMGSVDKVTKHRW